MAELRQMLSETEGRRVKQVLAEIDDRMSVFTARVPTPEHPRTRRIGKIPEQ